MPLIRIPKGWEIPEREATPESVYLDRRKFLASAGLLAIGAAAACRDPGGTARGISGGSSGDPHGSTAPAAPTVGGLMPTGAEGSAPSGAPSALLYSKGFPDDIAKMYPAGRIATYTLDRPLTGEEAAARYNNFYEFTEEKEMVATLAAGFTTRPWTISIGGLVRNPRTVDVDEVVRKMGLEERLYRHRCVERWAMALPWTGFPLRRFVEFCEPLGSARYVRFVSFLRPEEAPGQKKTWYPWPYFEGLSLAEATNDLAILATGIYGHPLPPQFGAPIRLVVPWKYGFKGIKSIVKVEFAAEKPSTFWNSIGPGEYDFVANVNPDVPHPRWSQASEILIGTGRRAPTLLYNGYAEYVAGIYRT